jgi:2'-5' RNA ligase
MINATSSLKMILEKRLVSIAQNIYGRDTKNVIYRVKTMEKHTNPRKLFFQGYGEILEGEVGLHMAVSQKIVINEDKENILFQEISKIVKNINSFTLKSTKLGDYGENFTIFLAFSKNKQAEKMMLIIDQNLESFFDKEREKRDILHFTLVYDDSSEENIKKAWRVIDKSSLKNKDLDVSSIWLWKNRQGWKPYKEFRLMKD